jgi:hypothetical protein
MELYCTPKVNTLQLNTAGNSSRILTHEHVRPAWSRNTPSLYVEFFQHHLLWQSSNTHSKSCSQKASKHSSGQSVLGLSVLLHTTTAPRRIVHHYPAIYQPRRSDIFTRTILKPDSLVHTKSLLIYDIAISIVTSPLKLLRYYGNATGCIGHVTKETYM